MYNNNEKIAVCSRSFSANSRLKSRVEKYFDDCNYTASAQTLVGSELVEFLKDAKYAIIGLEKITEEIILHCKKLKVVCKMGTGLDKIDVEALARNSIDLFHTPGFNKAAVVELVIAHMISILRNIYQNNLNLRAGDWKQLRGYELRNKKIGIVGFGVIGRELAKYLKVFGCDIYVTDIDKTIIDKYSHVQFRTTEQIFLNSDIITLHVPLSKYTYGLINSRYIGMMKKGSILINTARGELIDRDALFRRIYDNEIYAGLDVFTNEPEVDCELISHPHVFATPHIGGSTYESIEMSGNFIIDYLIQAKNVVV